MSYLGNILTNEKVEEDELFNIVSEESELLPKIPTIIIGWEKAKDLFPEVSIIDWEIGNDWFWTFGKRVRRDRFEKDLHNFKEYVIEQTIKKVSYVFFNVLTASTTEKKSLLELIDNDEKKFCLLSGDMVYLFNPREMTTYGISLEQIEYEGMNKSNFLRKILSSESIIKVKERDFISINTRELIKDRRYIIPYLAYILQK